MSRSKKIVNNTIYPDFIYERIARLILPRITDYWNSEEGQREYKAYLAEKAELNKNKATD